MEIKCQYKFIVDGEVIDTFSAKSRDELKKMIDSAGPWEDRFVKKKTSEVKG